MKQSRIPIALEGYPYIAVAAFAAGIMALLEYDFFALLLLLLCAFVLYFFRDPERICPDRDDAIVSPADGRILRIEKTFDERYLNDHVQKVSIFMNIFDVHVNRMPLCGTVDKIVYSPGKFYSANTERGGLDNESCGVVLTGDNEKRFAVVQIAGLIARRIVCRAEKGDRLERGRRFGIIQFGSRVDLYLPMQMQIEVAPGAIVKAGETVLGYLGSSEDEEE
ncbi:MAG: phosphatidylserine decarboxylase family protein [Desulfobulbaceae bacterium]|nr:phosphatidylserine decarboxylase family protein [Desulfobulbaceae bacterium]